MSCEVWALRGDFYVFDMAAWLRNWQTIFTHPAQMNLNSFADLLLGFFDCFARRHTSQQIRNIRGVVAQIR
jgi:hypothetical protein